MFVYEFSSGLLEVQLPYLSRQLGETKKLIIWFFLHLIVFYFARIILTIVKVLSIGGK